MLGTTKLQTLFGALRPGFNTAGEDMLKAMLKQLAAAGFSVMFFSSDPKNSKIPADYRPVSMRRRDDVQAQLEGLEKSRGGYYLSTSDSRRLSAMLREAKQQQGYTKDNAKDTGGQTPINFGIVPDRSRLVVIDCDTAEENTAFRNFFADHTNNDRLRTHVDVTPPSVLTPGVVAGGTWEQVQPAQWVDDYGTQVFLPATWENRGGRIVHAHGGHWYFFYPEGYELPEGTPLKITVSYDGRDRSPVLQRVRGCAQRLAGLQRGSTDYQECYDEYLDAVQALDAMRDEALQDLADREAGGKGAADLPRSNFTLMLHSSCVSIPPSSRYEGHYRVGSGEFAWEPWLSDLIARHAHPSHAASTHDQVPKQTTLDLQSPRVVADPAPTQPVDGFAVMSEHEVDDLNTLISDEWAWRTRWSDILCPHGWELTGQDTCGCDVFLAPGSHTSRKSATAHDSMCQLGSSNLGRLHIWTDNPPEEFLSYLEKGKRDFSKLNVVAILEHDGHAGAAMRALDIDVSKLPEMVYGDSDDFNAFLQTMLGPREPQPQGFEPVSLVRFGDLQDEEPPKFIVADTLEARSFSGIIGSPGSGKSFVGIALSCSLATGTDFLGHKCRKIKVAYFAGEGRSGVIERMRSWQEVRRTELSKRQHRDLEDNLLVANYLPNFFERGRNYQDIRNAVETHGAELLIIDTWSRANAGADENSAEVVSGTIQTLNELQRLTGCAILVIHHTAKGVDYARGSSALNGAFDTEILVKKVDGTEPEQWGERRSNRVLSVEVTKQKNTEQWIDPQYCRITAVGEDEMWLDDDDFPVVKKAPAAISDMDGVFTHSPADGLGGMANWELDAEAPTRADLPSQEDVLTAIRDVVWTVPGRGLTEAEVCKFVRERFMPEPGQRIPKGLDHFIKQNIDTAVRYKVIVENRSRKLTKPRENVASTPIGEIIAEKSSVGD